MGRTVYTAQKGHVPGAEGERLPKPAQPSATARRLTLITFGFKYGQPNANYYFDVSFLKNPARENRWGLFARVDDEMRRYLLDEPDCRVFLDAAVPLLRTLVRLDDDCRVGIGCSSGRHRSWIVGEELGRRLQSPDCHVRLIHREKEYL